MNLKIFKYSNINLGFIVKNLLIYISISIFIPLLLILFDFCENLINLDIGNDDYWLKPIISLIPLFYFIYAIYFLFKKNISKFVFFVFLAIFFTYFFLKISTIMR